MLHLARQLKSSEDERAHTGNSTCDKESPRRPLVRRGYQNLAGQQRPRSQRGIRTDSAQS